MLLCTFLTSYHQIPSLEWGNILYLAYPCQITEPYSPTHNRRSMRKVTKSAVRTVCINSWLLTSIKWPVELQLHKPYKCSVNVETEVQLWFHLMFRRAFPLYTDHLHMSRQIKPVSNEKHPAGNSRYLLRWIFLLFFRLLFCHPEMPAKGYAHITYSFEK